MTNPTEQRAALLAQIDKALGELEVSACIAGMHKNKTIDHDMQRRQFMELISQSINPEEKSTGQVYGIIDPDYGRVYTMVRKLAWEEGYAVGLHGSFTRDLDLMIVPWADHKVCEPEHLIRRIVNATGLHRRGGPPTQKPHGRLTWTLLFPEFGDPRFVDISIFPMPPEQPITAREAPKDGQQATT
jgi:hypothetical protein